jgi:predicted metal-binding protein
MTEKSWRAEKHIHKGEGIAPVSGGGPSPGFVEFCRRSRRELGDILGEVLEDAAGERGFTLRAGLMDPLHSVISERVREFCRLPYRTSEGTIASCPGILDNWKACPPHSPEVAETSKILSRAAGFLIVQFAGGKDRTVQADAHLLIEKAAGSLAERGYAIRNVYACGPCRICPRGCGEGGECRQPNRRLFALESCGFWVNALCRAAGEFPVFGGGPEEVRWIRDWGLAGQDTGDVRYVTGVILG